MNYSIPQPYNWKESIRKRPGMFIGNLRLTGFLIMLEYLMDEIIEDTDHKANIQFEFEGNKIKILVSEIEPAQLYTTIKTLNEKEKTDKLGFRVLTTLSENIKVEVCHGNSVILLQGGKGDFTITESGGGYDENNMKIEFEPDPEIFQDLTLNYEHINSFLRKFAYLNTAVKIISIDNGNEYQRNVFNYPLGVKHELDRILSRKSFSQAEMRLDLNTAIGDYRYQISFCHLTSWPEFVETRSYSNNYETIGGGSHVAGVLAGIKKALVEYWGARKENVEVNNKKILKNFLLVVAVRGDDFNYAGSTKSILDTPQIKSDLKKYIHQQVMLFLESNETESNRMLHSFKVWD